jgi:hypothetical protein
MNLPLKAKLATLLLVVIFGVTAFCGASAETGDKGARWSKICQSWIGADINDLIRKLGAPQSDYRMPDGDVIYRWSWTSSYTDPVELYPDGAGGYNSDGGYTVNFVCNTEFTTSPNGVIYDWKWNGNNC